jgi:hypothetical protein
MSEVSSASIATRWTGYVMTIFIGVLVWGGLYFRDYRLRNLIPLLTTA